MFLLAAMNISFSLADELQRGDAVKSLRGGWIRHFEPVVLPKHRLLRRRRSSGPLPATLAELARQARDDGGWDPRHTGPFTLPLTAFGATLELELAPANHLFTQDAFIEHVGADGEASAQPLNATG